MILTSLLGAELGLTYQRVKHLFQTIFLKDKKVPGYLLCASNSSENGLRTEYLSNYHKSGEVDFHQVEIAF